MDAVRAQRPDDAAVEEQRVCLRDLERGQLEHTERDGRIPLRRRADANLAPESGDVLEPDLFANADRPEVARHGERSAPRDLALVFLGEVLRLPDILADREGRRLVDGQRGRGEIGASLLGRPRDFTVTVGEVRISAGAGFLVPITGDILTMPGLPRIPAAERIDVDANGRITGLV